MAPTKTPTTTPWHHGPAWLWLLSFAVCLGGDWLLGRWVMTPLYVAGFYGGMIVIDLLTYPMLDRWRSWLQRRGLRMWYLVEIGAMWIGTTIVLILLAPWWLNWSWHGPLALQIVGAILMAVSVGIGVWAAGQMGWARLLFAGALFLPGPAAEANNVPQFLVVSGPYRYVRNPLYTTDMALIAGTALLTQNWGLVAVLLAYIAQLALQLPLEEQELRVRFGERYTGYCRAVPRFIPRLTPLDPADLPVWKG